MLIPLHFRSSLTPVMLSLLCVLTISPCLLAQVRYKVLENSPNAWHWMAGASLHTQNFNSANLHLTAHYQLFDWLMLSGNAHVPIWATSFSGDPNSGKTLFLNGGAVLRMGSISHEKDMVTISSSTEHSLSGTTRTTSYFEPDLDVYSYIGLRSGIIMANTAQHISGDRYLLRTAEGTSQIIDTTWQGETRTLASGLYLGFEWGRDNCSRIEYMIDGESQEVNPTYYGFYYVDFFYLPSVSYANFKANGREFTVDKLDSKSYGQLGGRVGFEQNSRFFHWGGEVGLYRRFGSGETPTIAENGYAYLSFFVGFTLSDW